ncbi:T-cell surface antigen CD2-like [Megalops cyprinoides]|uniref:T-cell surface antigen CD2-like n=1 Tax=Megalops cyprinoides TaxID=118141 RepID=UPI00186419A6|nr:T-cell surface antigen CD2-like [Megalops cyprinoides]
MDTVVKMTAVTVLLFGLARGSAELQQTCEYKAVGESTLISLQPPSSCKEESLTWKLNSNEFLSRKRNRVRNLIHSVNITADGSLQLKNLQMDGAGVYEAMVYDQNGRLCYNTTKPLCVMERVSKPSVSHKCSEDAVILTCNTKKSETDVTFEWSLNSQKIEGKVEKTFTVNGRPKPSDTYSCTARNKVGEEKSNDATIQCLDVQMSASVTWPNGDVREGDKVTILCTSSLHVDTFFLWRPKKSSPRMESKNGEFSLKNVEVDDSGIYTCQPQWLSGHPVFSRNATVNLLVSHREETQTEQITSGKHASFSPLNGIFYLLVSVFALVTYI